MAQAASAAVEVDQTLNPLVASLKVSKTMALTDMARSMREAGIDVSGLNRPPYQLHEPWMEKCLEWVCYYKLDVLG